MRILLALDGSPASEVACRLVAGNRWPAGSVIDVVGVVEPLVDVFGVGIVQEEEPPDGSLTDPELEAAIDRSVEALRDADLIMRRAMLVGRPASAIVSEAAEFRAELIVLGNRGRGRIERMLVGSVSAEVVDHARCSVLVARRPEIRRVLLAVDGSDTSRRAVEFVEANPVLKERRIEVLTVVPSRTPPAAVMLGGVYGASIEAYEDSVDAARTQGEGLASGAAAELRAAGYDVTWSISAGDAAHEIIASAARSDIDLVIMGSHGRTGVSRLLLGSVARNVLLHSGSSVLIVREPVRARDEESITVTATALAAIGHPA
jgi:nucleotide-binding universal stress UspA family protein